jgi:hypothetical protein
MGWEAELAHVAGRALPCVRGSGRRALPRALLGAAHATRAVGAARHSRLAAQAVPSVQGPAGRAVLYPRGRSAARPHTARVHLARGELHALGDVWRALERSGA